MKRIIVLCVIIFFFLISTSCTQNERAKYFGGTLVVKVDKGDKILNATWKNNDLWVMVEKPNGEKVFSEVSRWG